MPYMSQFFKNINEAITLLNNDLHDDVDWNSDFLVSMELPIGLRWHRASCPMAHLPFLLSQRASCAKDRHEPTWSRTTYDPGKRPTQALWADFRTFGEGIPEFWVWWACLIGHGNELTGEGPEWGLQGRLQGQPSILIFSGTWFPFPIKQYKTKQLDKGLVFEHWGILQFHKPVVLWIWNF